MHWGKRLSRRSKPAAPEGLAIHSASAEGLSAWEDEGGNVGQKNRADQGSLATLVDQGKESAAELALRTRRRAQRVRLALEQRRLESRIRSEIEGLGHDVLPLLREQSLRIEFPPAVDERMHTIDELQAELDRKKAESRDLRAVAERDEAKRESMMNTDANSLDEARAVQVAEDEAAAAADQPADEGGQG